MVGTDFVCPDATIKKLREEAKYISTTDDFVVQVRSELKDIFLRVIISYSTSSS
jgi:hypothetical protein